jgi:putative hydrolase of the HAD superfamily
MRRLTLLVNADNTLWESNVFFEHTLERFFSLVEPFGYARAYARHILNETERQNIQQHGYGVRSFARSLEQSYMKLAGGLAQRSALDEVASMVAELEHTPPRVLDGVPETLAYLSSRHRMILFTKGEPAEEAAKVERSGLQGFFDSIEIVADKNIRVYGDLVDKHHVVKSYAWLVGSSAQLEINPALQAGLNAAFVPHAPTWNKEDAELHGGAGKLLIISSFRGLRDHF